MKIKSNTAKVIKFKSKNIKLLDSFNKYCLKHPEQRFWQALKNWAKVNFIVFYHGQDLIEYDLFEDTYYLNERNK